MKDEKKPKSRTNYRVGFCLFMAVVFLTVSLQTAAREKPFFTGDSRLFNHYGDDNGLFSTGYLSGMDMSSQGQIDPGKDKPRVSFGKFFGEIGLGMLGNIAGGYGNALIGYQIAKKDCNVKSFMKKGASQVTAIWALMKQGFGLWKCGKACSFPTFLQTLFFLYYVEFDPKSPPEGGGNKKAAKEEKKPVLGLYPTKLLRIYNESE